MPHQQRHTKKAKKPKRTQPLDISIREHPEVLKEHRELALLRIAGGARPGKHKRKLLNERYRKLDEIDKILKEKGDA